MTAMTETRVEVPWHLLATSVRRVSRIAPSFVRVTLTAPAFSRLDQGPGDQRIKLLLPLADGSAGLALGLCDGAVEDWYSAWRAMEPGERNPMRTYTIRAVRPEVAELDVDLVLHGDGGPASRWACSVTPGDQVAVVAPNGDFDGDPGGYEWRPPTEQCELLLGGDETAAPAICAILESLPDDASATAFIEVPEPEDALALDLPDGVTLTWLPRLGAPVGALLDPAVRAAAAVIASRADADQAARTLRNLGTEPDEIDVDTALLWDVPAAGASACCRVASCAGADRCSTLGPCTGIYAWLAGEAGAITGLRRHLVRDLGVPRNAVAFMGYWRLGRSALD